jgi:hypothetical protein
MNTHMDELLAQAYGTADNIASLQGDYEKTAEAAIFEELEKVAAAEGIDLNDLSDEDIAEILAEVLGESGEYYDDSEKTAGVDDGDMAKIAEADFLGRTMAHAFYSEMANISYGSEKTAGYDDFEEQFEAAAIERANEILYLAQGGEIEYDDDDYVKTAGDDEIDAALTERAAELLEDNGYDVDDISAILFG